MNKMEEGASPPAAQPLGFTHPNSSLTPILNNIFHLQFLPQPKSGN